jgi:hypothetical protein
LGTSLLKKNTLSLICSIIILTLIIVGCHADSQKQSNLNDSDAVVTNNSESLSDEGLSNKVSPQNIQQITDAITKQLMPLASEKDKEELNKIMLYFSDIQQNIPGYFEVPENNIGLLKNIMNVALMEGKLKPDDFASQLNVSIQYLQISRTIRELSSSEESDRLSAEYEKKGIRTAFDLVKKFPDNGMAYGHLAHSLYTYGGEKKKSIELYKRCLEFDRESQFCKDGYAALLDE